jgi:hypothetical protein
MSCYRRVRRQKFTDADVPLFINSSSTCLTFVIHTDLNVHMTSTAVSIFVHHTKVDSATSAVTTEECHATFVYLNAHHQTADGDRKEVDFSWTA